MTQHDFNFADERFADIQMLRYRLNGFDSLTLQQKKLVYCLAEATLWGRDITFDQFGKYNLRIRKMLEVVFSCYAGQRESNEFQALVVYLKRVWFSSGIHHHYGCDKFVPEFSQQFLRDALHSVDAMLLPLGGQTVDEMCDELFPVIFCPDVMAKRVNQADGDDLVRTSACNFYEDVSQEEVEQFYAAKKDAADTCPPSYGLNSTLRKREGRVEEVVWSEQGRYGAAIKHIVEWLEKAIQYAENQQQEKVIKLLVKYYKTGDLRVFDEYSIEWVAEQQGRVDFVNGFIEVYGDPLGLKGSWEGIVEYKDLEATRRTQTISQQAQWFEDHSPVDPRFRKKQVTGVTANVVCAAMLGGDEYPASAIGINLPNADWIRARFGSKSVTIGNLTEAYNQAARGSGMREEFVDDAQTIALINQYGDMCDDLHTDLHECLGHGSGQLLPGVKLEALKAYGSTIEEARADLFALYYMADPKLVELGLLPNGEAYKSQYYTYMMNGLLTQLTRIKPGHQIEEAHMRNRALIARWCHAHGEAMQIYQREGRTYLRINDYSQLRTLIAQLLAEVQRIKSEGDYEAARQLVENYGVQVDAALHQEILQRYERLNLAPYKGFINPVMTLVRDGEGQVVDVVLDYSEGYAQQMMRYSRDYSVYYQ
ncbi:MAG: dihydrofolate reductase [Prevotella sp.]|nr:dihydrofolate reductase [Prevotella sp.]